VLCMRTTLHVVPGDEVPFFFQAYVERQSPAERRGTETLLVQAGLCGQEEAGDLLQALHRRVLDVLAEKGPSTVRAIGQAVPELKAQVRHNVGKSYEGQFSVGSRLVPGMCALGLLIRARPRGTWRSNLHAYAALLDWLPGVDLEAITPQESRAWLARRYLSAFGPAPPDDVQWWTGFSGRETEEALWSRGASRGRVRAISCWPMTPGGWTPLTRRAVTMPFSCPVSIHTSWAAAFCRRNIATRSLTGRGTRCRPSGPAGGWWASGSSAGTGARSMWLTFLMLRVQKRMGRWEPLSTLEN
jgi:hypothetical protein